MYGFGYQNRYIDTFRGREDLLKESGAEFNPLEVKIEDRMDVKFQNEADEFDPERYAFDNFEDEQLSLIRELIYQKIPSIQESAEEEKEAEDLKL